MKTLNTDDSRQPAYVVFADVKEQNEMYWPRFAKPKQELALRLKLAATNAYFRSKVYLNARDKYIVVKVDRPTAADKLQNGELISALHKFVTKHGIDVVATKNNLLFRIAK